MGWLLVAFVLTAAGLIVKVAVGIARWLSTLRALNQLPHPKMGLLGCTALFDQHHVSQTFTRLANELGGIFYVRILHVPLVVIADPALWQHALRPGVDLPKAPTVYKTMDQMTSPDGRQPSLLGHLTHDGYWKLVRKAVAPAFSPRNIRAEFPHVLELAEQLSSILAASGEQYIDVDNLLQRESLDVIGRIGFATTFGAIQAYRPPSEQHQQEQQQQPLLNGRGNSNAGGGRAPAAQQGDGSLAGIAGSGSIDTRGIFDVIMDAGHEVVLRLANPLRWLIKNVTQDGRQGEQRLRDMQAQMRALLQDIKARGPPAEGDTSIAAHLLRIRDPATGQPLTDEQLATEIGLFFFAGFETTGHTAAWTLFLLAQHPEAESKVCAELDALGLLATPSRPNPRRLEYADLAKLKYLGMVLKEAMRLVPVSGGTVRISHTPLQLGGYSIPAGVQIIFAVHALHNSERHWERPSEFMPERWEEPQAESWLGGSVSSEKRAAAKAQEASEEGLVLVEDEDAVRVDDSRPPKRFLPFSAGSRNCIGQNLAKMNATATLALLLSRFTFKLPPELMGPDALWAIHANRLTMQPKDGLPMRCIPRTAL